MKTSLVVSRDGSDLYDRDLLLVTGGLGGGPTTQWHFLDPLALDGDYSLAFIAPIARELVGRHRDILKVPGFARAIAGEIEALSPKSLTLVSHSVGTFVAVSLASKVKVPVRQIVVVNGALDTVGQFIHRPFRTFVSEPATCSTALRLFAMLALPVPEVVRSRVASSARLSGVLLRGLVSPSNMTPATVEKVISAGGAPETLAALAINRHHWLDFVDEAASVDCLVTLVCGTDDKLAPERDAPTFAARFRNSDVISLPAVGHAAPLEAPDTLSTLLTKLLV